MWCVLSSSFIAALFHKKNVCVSKKYQQYFKVCVASVFCCSLLSSFIWCIFFLCFIFCFLFFHNVFDSVCSCFSPERRLFVAFYFARFSVFLLLLLLLLLPLSLLLLLHRKRLESQIPAWQRFIYNQSRFRLVTQPAESRLRRRLRRRCRQRVNVSVSLSLSLSHSLAVCGGVVVRRVVRSFGCSPLSLVSW